MIIESVHDTNVSAERQEVMISQKWPWKGLVLAVGSLLLRGDRADMVAARTAVRLAVCACCGVAVGGSEDQAERRWMAWQRILVFGGSGRSLP